MAAGVRARVEKGRCRCRRKKTKGLGAGGGLPNIHSYCIYWQGCCRVQNKVNWFDIEGEYQES